MHLICVHTHIKIKIKEYFQIQDFIILYYFQYSSLTWLKIIFITILPKF